MRRRLTAAVALALSCPVACAADLGTGAGVELWRGAVDDGLCAVELVNELGGVDVRPSGRRILVRAEEPELGIEAADARGDLKLTVTGGGRGATGDVVLRVPPRCDVTVRTTGGAVDVDLGPVPRRITVDTVTGDITVRADPAAAATVRLATSGEITTDYTIAIDFRYHEEPAKVGHVVVAGGGSAAGGDTEVRLTSRRGAVRVLRPPVESDRVP